MVLIEKIPVGEFDLLEVDPSIPCDRKCLKSQLIICLELNCSITLHSLYRQFFSAEMILLYTTLS